MPEEMPWAEPVVVPDDIRSLQPDIDAYHRELRHARRQARRRRLGAAGWPRWAVPAGALFAAMLVAAVVFALLTLDTVGHRTGTAAAPLAHPAAVPGTAGGLLPAVTVTTTDGTEVAVQSLRPALVVLLPQHCSCPVLVDSLGAQAAEVQLPLVVIGPSSPDAEVAALPGQLHHGRVVAGYDHDGALASTYAAHGVTALVLGRDGVVTYLQRDLTSSTRLELPLQAALLP